MSIRKLLKGMICHVNVIPLNPTQGFGGKPTPKEGVDQFIGKNRYKLLAGTTSYFMFAIKLEIAFYFYIKITIF